MFGNCEITFCLIVALIIMMPSFTSAAPFAESMNNYRHIIRRQIKLVDCGRHNFISYHKQIFGTCRPCPRFATCDGKNAYCNPGKDLLSDLCIDH